MKAERRFTSRGLKPKLWSILLLTAPAIFAQGSLYRGNNDWTNVGPEGGSFWELVADPQNPDIIYATAGAGLFKSKDGGASWNNAGLNGYEVHAMSIDPQQPTILYAAASNSREDEVALVNVFKSTDGGDSWNESDAGLPGCCVGKLAIDPQNTGTLYALNSQGPTPGLFSSTDAGATWRMIYAPSSGRYFDDIAIDPRTPGTLYVAGHLPSGVVTVFKSLDGGENWSEADTGLPSFSSYDVGTFRIRLTVDPASPATIYATIGGLFLFRTTDGAASWRAMNFLLSQNAYTPRISAVLIDPQDNKTLYVPSSHHDTRQPGAVFKSTDWGASWNASGPVPWMTSRSNSVTIDPRNSSTLSAATIGGVYRSTDGGASFFPYSQARALQVLSVALDPQRSGAVLAGVDRGFGLGGASVLQSSDAGMSWRASGTNLGDGGVVALAIDPQNPSVVYAGTATECGWSPSKIFRSVDGGSSWTDTQSDVDCLSTIVADPRIAGTVYASSRYAGFLLYRGIGLGSGIKKSTDGGMTWNDASSGIPLDWLGLIVIALAIDPQNTRTLFASECGRVGCKVFKSADGGAHWIEPKPGIPVFSGNGVSAFGVDPQTPGSVYAAIATAVKGGGGGIWKSVDGGANWRNVFPAKVYTVAVNPQNPATIYSGADNGLARSTDGGETWTAIPGGPGRVTVLALDPQDPDTVYAGGQGGLFAIRFAR